MNNNDELSKSLNWRVSSLKIFTDAFRRYIEVAAPYASKDNTELFEEYSQVQKFLRYFREYIAKGEGDFDVLALTFLGKNWGKIHDILWKYYGWKKQLLEEKKQTITIQAALEGDAHYLENIGEVLKNPCWELFNRRHILIDSFYTNMPQKTTDPMVQQFFNVETLNGILTANNSGTIIQNNENKEVLHAIQELASILKEGKITDQDTAEAFQNLQDLQGELLKPYPDNSRMKKAGEKLQTLANATQIGSFLIAVAPHLNKIRNFVESLPFPQ